MRDVSVLIVGAGPTGLTLACDLLSRGVDVTVLDRQKQFASTTRALGLQPRGRQILDRLGALGDLRTKAPLQSEFDVYLNGQLALHVDLGTLRGRYDDGVLRVPQTEIERQLRERLHRLGGEICWGYEVIGVCEEGTSIRASVRTEDDVQSVNAKWVVGCMKRRSSRSRSWIICNTGSTKLRATGTRSSTIQVGFPCSTSIAG